MRPKELRCRGTPRCAALRVEKKKAISTAGANGGELNLADAQEDAGAEDANLGKEREPPRAVLNALKGQPLDLKER